MENLLAPLPSSVSRVCFVCGSQDNYRLLCGPTRNPSHRGYLDTYCANIRSFSPVFRNFVWTAALTGLIISLSRSYRTAKAAGAVGGAGGEVLELYNLARDPGERHNLATRRWETVLRLKNIALNYYRWVHVQRRCLHHHKFQHPITR